LLEANQVSVKLRGADHPETRKCLQAIVDLYVAWHAAQPGKGFDAKAAEWKAKLGRKKDNRTSLK
jgi:hypothetical protein